VASAAGGYIGAGVAASTGERVAGALVGALIAALWLLMRLHDAAWWAAYGCVGRLPPERRLFVCLPRNNTARQVALPQWSSVYALPLLMAAAATVLEPLQFGALRALLVGRLGARSAFALKFAPKPVAQWAGVPVAAAAGAVGTVGRVGEVR